MECRAGGCKIESSGCVLGTKQLREWVEEKLTNQYGKGSQTVCVCTMRRTRPRRPRQELDDADLEKSVFAEEEWPDSRWDRQEE
jgi:hypothetical protein